MRTLAWGLIAAWLGGLAIIIGPIALTALSGGGFADFETVGGVGAYATWVATASTLVGLLLGSSRLFVRSKLGMRFMSGVMVLVLFSSQFVMFGGVELSRENWLFVLGVMFGLGFLFGPAMAKGLYNSFPELHDWGAPEHERERREQKTR